MAEPKITEGKQGTWGVAEFRDDDLRWAVEAAGFLEQLGARAKDAKVVSLPNENMGLVFFPVRSS